MTPPRQQRAYDVEEITSEGDSEILEDAKLASALADKLGRFGPKARAPVRKRVRLHRKTARSDLGYYKAF